jgi:hypothetical protein
MSILGDRRFVRDYTPIRRANEAALTETSSARPCAYERATIPELVAEVDRIAGHLKRGHVRGARFLLTYLNGLPGETWNDRWLLFDDQTQGQRWREIVMPKRSHLQDMALTAGLGALLMLDVFRPTYSWTLGRKMPVYRSLTTFRDPEGAAIFEASLSELGYVRIYMNKVLTTAGQLQSHTGKSIRELEAADLLELLANSERSPQNHRNGLRVVWRLLYDLGWLHHESAVLPDRNRRRGRLTPEQIVDHYEIREPQRSVLVEYLTHRSPALEYNSLRSLASHLVHHFWRDIQDHHPDLKDFVVTRQMMSAYRDRKFGGDQAAAPSTRSDVLFAVRAFYLDVAQWALHDAYWAPWVAATPVTRVDVQAATKERRKVIARTQQRTRVLAPVLPRLIEVADTLRRDTAAVLAMAKAAGPGGGIEIDGASWEVVKASPESPLRLHRDGVTRRIEAEEENAFWTWALVETFRHSGLRSEEVLELTHLAIQPYKLPATGETIPLLHIVNIQPFQRRVDARAASAAVSVGRSGLWLS